MTLSYWWMHWFWITTCRFCVCICGENITSEHSTIAFPTSDYSHYPASTTASSPSKPPKVKKNNNNNNNNIGTNVSTDMTDYPVINATEPEYNMTDFSFINETTNFNQTLLNSDLDNLSAAGITGITLGCVLIFGIICGVSFFIYRNRGFNRPQVLNDRCSNPDSSGYLDDTSVRDNSEEMYSLDNDSFLNSLEAMTIQNYWTDTVKHTKL